MSTLEDVHGAVRRAVFEPSVSGRMWEVLFALLALVDYAEVQEKRIAHLEAEVNARPRGSDS